MDEYQKIMDSMSPDEVLDIVLMQSEHAKPARTLTDQLMRHKVPELRDMAYDIGIPGGISSMNKRTLVSKLVATLNAPTEMLLAFLVGLGTSCIADMRRLCDMGGCIEVPFDELRSFDQVIFPRQPFCTLYDWQRRLYCIMPTETYEKLKNIDWDVLIERARPLEEALDFLDKLVDLRGVVRLDEAFAELYTFIPQAPDKEVIFSALEGGAGGKLTDFVLIDMLEELCLVHGTLFKYMEESDYGEDDVHSIFFAQEDFRPHPLSDELIAARSVASAVLELPAGQAFVSFFEQRAPQGIDPRLFGNTIYTMAVKDARDTQSSYILLQLFRDFGFHLDKEDIEKVVSLYAALTAHVPRWDRNGWTLFEEACGDHRRPSADPEPGEAEVLQFTSHATSEATHGDGEVVPFTPAVVASTKDPDDDLWPF